MKKRQYFHAIRRDINYLILCSTKTDKGIDTLEEVNREVRKTGYQDCGHHLVIRRDGTVEPCRRMDESARCSLQHNVAAISVAYIGGKMDGEPFFTATQAQLDAMRNVVTVLKLCFPMVSVHTRQSLTGNDIASKELEEMTDEK